MTHQHEPLILLTDRTGRTSQLGNGVLEALGRVPGDFSTFVARVAADGTWTSALAQGAR